jgi:hypothetical protein
VKNLKRVARELGESVSEEELQAMIDEFDRDGDAAISLVRVWAVYRFVFALLSSSAAMAIGGGGRVRRFASFLSTYSPSLPLLLFFGRHLLTFLS